MIKTEIKAWLEDARTTLKNVKKSDKEKWVISKEQMIKFCNKTISLCKTALERKDKKGEQIW